MIPEKDDQTPLIERLKWHFANAGLYAQDRMTAALGVGLTSEPLWIRGFIALPEQIEDEVTRRATIAAHAGNLALDIDAAIIAIEQERERVAQWLERQQVNGWTLKSVADDLRQEPL